MNVFQCLLCNQYAEITKKGGDGRKAHLNTLLLLTAIMTLWVVFAILAYDYIQPGFLRKIFDFGLSGKNTGKFLAIIVGLIVFICLKLTIGTKKWYENTIDQYNAEHEDDQKRISRKGIRFFAIGFIPIIIGIVWAFTTLF